MLAGEHASQPPGSIAVEVRENVDDSDKKIASVNKKILS
jgi:hypothetical protein